jgi:glutathione synthase/RimK-type ligase-like ATP-grasp enzyme
MSRSKSLTILYEHPHWFNPLFEELERREIPHQRVDAASELFDPDDYGPDDVVFNRISPSAWTRARGALIFQTLGWTRQLELNGADVINGSAIFELEISKAAQGAFLQRIGVTTPRTEVTTPAGLEAASERLAFPLLVKPNVGGSGAGVRLLTTREELLEAVASGSIDRGGDGLLLLQEYHAPRDGVITRVETLDGAYLYGIRIHLGDDGGFDLCPADVCKTTDGASLTSSACPADSRKKGLSVEAFTPPDDVIDVVENIAHRSRLDVGGIEYLESDRDGRRYFYDINALSNFVADPLRVIGFDPTARVVDSIEEPLQARRQRRVS